MNRIIIIAAKLHIGGAEKVARYIALYANSEEYEFHYVVFGEEVGTYERQLLEKGCKVFHLEEPSVSYLRFISELLSLMKQNRYHAIHAHKKKTFGEFVMNKTKVLIVAGEMNLGGLENQLMHLLRNANPKHFQIDYTSTTPESYYRKEIEELGGGFLLIPHMSHANPFPYCKALYRIMKDGKYDVVHSHELFHSGIVLLVAKLAGVPVRVAHAHNWQDGDGTGRKRGLIRTVYNTVMRQLIVGCSTHQMACSSLAGKFLYGEKCTRRDTYQVVFNSVDTSKILDRYDQKECGEFCDGWINVLQVARVSKVKNQLFMTDVAKELKHRSKKIRILCAGSGDESDVQSVREAICEKNVSEHIQLLGSRSDIDVLLRKAHAFVLPSHYEGMPLALIEAQASGLPCVAADTFSHEVDFEIGNLQWLPLDGNAVRWADAIEAAVAQGRADKEQVVRVVNAKRFDSKMFAETLCELYAKALEKKA